MHPACGGKHGAETIKGSVKLSARDDEDVAEKAWARINPLLTKECTLLHLSKDGVEICIPMEVEM